MARVCDSFCFVVGLNLISRKLARSIPSSTQVVQISDNEYAVNTILPFKTHQQKFILGEEIEQNTIDGRRVKNVFTLENGNRLIEKQIEKNREVTLIREFTGNEMLGKSVVGDVTSNHWSILVD